MKPEIKYIIQNALLEDGYLNDVTTDNLIPSTKELTGYFIAKEDGVLSGIEIGKEVFLFIDPSLNLSIFTQSGSLVKKGDIIAEIHGKAASILKGERVSLNIIQRMSGIATVTHKFVSLVQGTNAKILDTRKTTPLVRVLEKQAVVDGGGTNHRYNLSDMVLIKDNHIAAVGGITKAVETARSKVGTSLKIEVEVETKDQFLEAINTSADIIMLDNMSNELTKELVEINQGKKLLEASGNMSLDRVKSVAETGVDYISVGALTHSYQSLDISLKFKK
jgi:nicotinate-nucleotide pyrophosphorylase (carboxylating)